jgi:hypothetical protein
VVPLEPQVFDVLAQARVEGDQADRALRDGPWSTARTCL